MKVLLVFALIAFWFWLVYVIIDGVLGAFGLIPAIIVGVILLTTRWGAL